MPKLASTVVVGTVLFLPIVFGSLVKASTVPKVSNLSVTGPNGTQPAGTNLTFVAHASGNGGLPEYQFWEENANGQWHVVQNYSTKNSFTINSVGAGSYPITVYALDANQIASGQWSQALFQTFIVNVDASVSASVPSSAHGLPIGQPLTIQASSTHLIQPVYQFWIENPKGTWSSSGNYSPSSMFAFIPTQTGTYHYVVYAKDPIAPNTARFSLAYEGSLTTVPYQTYLESLSGQPYYNTGIAINQTSFGNTLTIAGTSYQHGLSYNAGTVNGPATANFLLNRNYSTFSAL
ncbi:MAG: hypothetical protein C7B47_16145, partial [Sulfobacillus thermosulfidooxidans]